MALTLEAEQLLQKVGLIVFYENNEDLWTAAAQKTYDFVTDNFPENAVVRRDDVAKVLKSILDVDEDLSNFLAGHKIKQKYWIQYFTDLIIDRTWDTISTGGDEQ